MGMINTEICKRAKYLNEHDINTDVLCLGCSEDEDKSCTAVFVLSTILEKSKEYSEVGE